MSCETVGDIERLKLSLAFYRESEQTALAQIRQLTDQLNHCGGSEQYFRGLSTTLQNQLQQQSSDLGNKLRSQAEYIERLETELKSAKSDAQRHFEAKEEATLRLSYVEVQLRGLKQQQNDAERNEASRLVHQANADFCAFKSGSMSNLLSIFLASPCDCPRCGSDLGEWFGVELLSKAWGMSIVELRALAVKTFAADISNYLANQPLRRFFLEQTTSVNYSSEKRPQDIPPVASLNDIIARLEGIPNTVFFLPLDEFCSLLDQVRFLSEMECYGMVIRFAAIGPRFVRTGATMNTLLDHIRFLWLPCSFVDTELTRLSGSLKVSGAADREPLLEPLLQRLQQTVRVKALLLDLHERCIIRGGSVKEALSNMMLNPYIHEELQRLRITYQWLPASISARVNNQEEGGGGNCWEFVDLVRLQTICS